MKNNEIILFKRLTRLFKLIPFRQKSKTEEFFERLINLSTGKEKRTEPDRSQEFIFKIVSNQTFKAKELNLDFKARAQAKIIISVIKESEGSKLLPKLLYDIFNFFVNNYKLVKCNRNKEYYSYYLEALNNYSETLSHEEYITQVRSEARGRRSFWPKMYKNVEKATKQGAPCDTLCDSKLNLFDKNNQIMNGSFFAQGYLEKNFNDYLKKKPDDFLLYRLNIQVLPSDYYSLIYELTSLTTLSNSIINLIFDYTLHRLKGHLNKEFCAKVASSLSFNKVVDLNQAYIFLINQHKEYEALTKSNLDKEFIKKVANTK